jgi:hypothetical protein
MKNNYNYLIKNTTSHHITFLSDINNLIKFDKRGKFKYFYIPYNNFKLIENFIYSLNINHIFTLIPLISIYGKEGDPHLVLSKQILVTRDSNPSLINDFVNIQLDKTILDFDVNLDNKFHYLIFKYKKITII